MATFVFASFGAKAQLTHLEQSVYLNFSLPSAQFNDDVTSIPMRRFNVGKGAGAGLGLGYRVTYRFDVGFGEVSPFLSADIFWNRSNRDLRDMYMDADDGKFPNYINLPIFVGVNYRYQLTEIFTPFAEVGFGPDILFISKEYGSLRNATVLATTNVDYDFTLKYQTTTKLAYQVGLGCYFGQHVSASLHWYGFSKHAIKYTNGIESDLATVQPNIAALDQAEPDYEKTQSRNIGLFALRVGFHF
ncbi:MAG: outer membrane beta-barrel protein [Bacteroidales bacterium]|nr:outer membrane beta-barrel protein [Bacteroidales bacterium]